MLMTADYFHSCYCNEPQLLTSLPLGAGLPAADAGVPCVLQCSMCVFVCVKGQPMLDRLATYKLERDLKSIRKSIPDAFQVTFQCVCFKAV